MLSAILLASLSAPLPAAFQEPAPAAAPLEPALSGSEEPARRSAQARPGGGGWLGVELRESGSGDERQLEITGVTEGSAAARAGLRAGDRIQSLNERPAQGYAEFAALVQGHGPGTRVHVTVERETEARLGEQDGEPRLGVSLDGASVAGITPGSAAAQAGLQAGDRLIAIGDQECTSDEDVIAAIQSHEPGDVVGLTLRRNVPVVLGSRPGASDEAVLEPPRGQRADAEAERAAAAERRASEGAERQSGAAERQAEAERRGVEAERRAEISNLQAQVRELSAALDRLRRELDELQRELDRLR